MTDPARPLDGDDVEILARETAYRGYFRIDRYRLRHRLHGGGWSAEMVREVFERGHAVAVLLYDPDRDTLAMIEQFRVGALAAGVRPWLLEIVAGIIEDGETEEQVVRREAAEEAGCAIGELRHACTYLVSPGGATETVSVYVGRIDSQGVGGVHGMAAEGEDIRVVLVPAAEALAMLERGVFNNGAILIAMQWFALHRDTLRRAWLGS